MACILVLASHCEWPDAAMTLIVVAGDCFAHILCPFVHVHGYSYSSVWCMYVHMCTQGVMLDIIAMILIVVEENLPYGILWTPWSDLFYALTFWFIFLLLVYCLFFCFM